MKLISTILALSFLLTPLAYAEQVKLPDGTKIRLKLRDNVSGDKVSTGSDVNFEVSEDVFTEDGKTVLIKSGTAAIGTVTNAEKRRRMGGGGELTIGLERTKAVDGTKVPLRATLNKDGGSTLGASVALTVLITPLFLLMRGKEAKLAAGTILTGYTDNDVLVNLPELATKNTP